MPKMPINKFFRELDASLDEREASFEERVGEHMAYRAALYIMRGNDASPLKRDVDPEELESYASQLKKLGIGDYAARCYGGLDPEKVDLKSLQFAYFLYQNADRLQLPSSMAGYALKGELEESLQEMEEAGKISFADYWLSRASAREEARNAGDYREEDRSVYEYEAPDEVWKDYVAGSLMRKGMGAVTAKRENVDRFKKSPFDVLTLRNKRTVEKVRRGELSEVAAARRATERSFTFLRPQDLDAARLEARNLSRQMADCTGAAAESEEWRSLKAAVFSFHTAENPADAAAASADVLLAVEKFTKGKKSSRQNEETAACVDLALKALGTTIPDAARNPSVKPLTDRFNDVRSRRLQKKIEIPGNRYYSAAMPDKDCAFLLGRELTEAKEKASALHAEMTGCTGAVTRSPEWQRLTAAVKDFSEAQDVTAAAAASERILEETVKFTKGKKNAEQTPETAACVKLALKSLETAIPSPEQNLKVQALIDRFNEVRADRKQEPVEFAGNDSLPNSASDKEIRMHEQRRLGRRLDALNGFLAKEGQVPPEEGEMLETIAAAIALEEASEGTMDVRKALYGRIRELKEDPVVQGMARRAATDPDELQRIRMNSDFEDLNSKTGTFGLYARETYRRQKTEIREQQSQQADQELLKAREAIENARKELKEKEVTKTPVSQAELKKRERALDEGLLEMGSDYYKLNSYDPEKAAELFAEVLTVKEMRDAQAKGRKPSIREMQARISALKFDPTVRRMAKTLPRDEKFRIYISACEERNISTVPTLTTALEHAYAAYSKGKQLSECYLEHRDMVRRLGGDFPVEKPVTPREATHLAASLIALKEVETLSGRKDVTLDEKKLEARIAQLEQEPLVIQTGKNLLASKLEEFIGGLVEKKAEPEQVIAGTMYRAFKKQHPEKLLQPGAEAVKPDGEIKPEAKQDGEIKMDEPEVPAL